MKTVKILRGIPGSGKSTTAKNLWVELAVQAVIPKIFSADHFFMERGVYIFNYKKLDAAHNQCFRQFVEAAVAPPPETGHDEVLIVDNTNTTVLEMSPYVRIAKSFGLSFEVVTIDCPVEIAAARCIHAVPANRVQAMFDRLKNNQVPKDWPHRVIQSEIV